jgi:hypothetical protein
VTREIAIRSYAKNSPSSPQKVVAARRRVAYSGHNPVMPFLRAARNALAIKPVP